MRNREWAHHHIEEVNTMGKKKPAMLKFMLAIDQLGNNIPLLSRLLFGPYANESEDETISSALGKLKKANKGKIPWRYPVAKLVDLGLDKIDKNHSVDAIEHDEGRQPK